MSANLPDLRQPKLTVALIARDAEELLPATIESIRFVADEILVVDTGSLDRTCAIAADANAKILNVPWNDDFSAPRNLALAQATGDWILWLDAGETVTAEVAQAIKLFIREQADPARAYLMVVEVPPEGKTISSEQVGRIRLLPNFKGLRYEGRVRERLNNSLAGANVLIEMLPWKIQRSAREHDPLVKSGKARRDLRLAELEMQEHGRSAAMLNVLGDAYSRLGDTVAAIDSFRRGLEVSQRGSVDMLEAYYGLLAVFDADASQQPEQFRTCLAALEIYPLDAQLLCAMGSYLQMQGRIDLALRAYQAAAENGQVDPQTWHLGDINDVATVCRCLCLQLLNQDDTARQVLVQALAREGSAPRLRRQLIELYVKHDLRQEALEQINLMPAETVQREPLRTAVRGACLAAKQNWAAAVGYLRAAHAGGCRDPLCLRWLAVSLIALGEFQEAEPILAEWHEEEPKHPDVAKYVEIIAQRRSGTGPTPPPSLPPLPASLPASSADLQYRIDPSRHGAPAPPNAPTAGKPASGRSPFLRT